MRLRTLLDYLVTMKCQQNLAPKVITPVNGSENEFEEFPDDPALDDFDPDDRKFIAVTIAHPEKPPILQAVDSQWWDFRDAFRRNGVTVEFICEDDIQRVREVYLG